MPAHHVEYVRFQDVNKAVVTLADALTHYDIRQQLAAKSNGGLRGPCPFGGGSSHSRPFHVTPSRQGWHCFHCDEGGDVILFVAKMEGVSLPEAGARIAVWFSISQPNPGSLPHLRKSPLAPPSSTSL